MQTPSSSNRQSQCTSAEDASVLVVAILSSSENGVIFGAIAFYVAKMSQQLQKEREGSVEKYVICNNKNEFDLSCVNSCR